MTILVIVVLLLAYGCFLWREVKYHPKPGSWQTRAWIFTISLVVLVFLLVTEVFNLHVLGL